MQKTPWAAVATAWYDGCVNGLLTGIFFLLLGRLINRPRVSVRVRRSGEDISGNKQFTIVVHNGLRETLPIHKIGVVYSDGTIVRRSQRHPGDARTSINILKPEDTIRVRWQIDAETVQGNPKVSIKNAWVIDEDGELHTWRLVWRRNRLTDRRVPSDG